MSNVAIDLTKTVKEIITTMKTAIDNLNTNVDSLKSEILLAAHPVGSYYISDNATDPGTLFGGTWKMLDPGLTLISQGKGTDKFGSFEFVAGQTYGERLHQLTIDELPKIKGSFGCSTPDFHSNFANGVFSGIHFGDKTGVVASAKDYKGTIYGYHIEFGHNQPHNTLQPSRAAYIWCRVS